MIQTRQVSGRMLDYLSYYGLTRLMLIPKNPPSQWRKGALPESPSSSSGPKPLLPDSPPLSNKPSYARQRMPMPQTSAFTYAAFTRPKFTRLAPTRAPSASISSSTAATFGF